MQNILTIDTSSDPAVATVVEVSDRQLKVLESYSAPISPAFSVITNGFPADQDDQDGVGTYTDHLKTIFEGEQTALKELLNKIKTPWYGSVLIISPKDQITLNLDLPFNEDKQLAQILEMEVQDLVPFDLSEFVIDNSCTGERPDGLFDIYVTLAPEALIKQVLEFCRSTGFEPHVVTTPGSNLEAFFHLYKGKVPRSSGALLFDRHACYFCASIDGEIVATRTIRLPERGSQTEQERAEKLLSTRMKSTVSSIERRYRAHIEQIYLVGHNPFSDSVLQALNIPVEQVDTSQTVMSREQIDSPGALAAIFALDYKAPTLLTNFRTGPFGFNPKLRLALAATKKLLPYLAGLLLAGILSLFGLFYIREYKIAELQNAIRTEIKTALPGEPLTEGRELQALQTAEAVLNGQLSSLGSLTADSPLDIFLKLTSDIHDARRRAPDLDITKLKIAGNKVTFDGKAPDYSHVENLERTLKRQKAYCQVLRKTSGSRVQGSTRTFSFELTLCE